MPQRPLPDVWRMSGNAARSLGALREVAEIRELQREHATHEEESNAAIAFRSTMPFANYSCIMTSQSVRFDYRFNGERYTVSGVPQ